MEEINVYCDESCHLLHDNSNIMLMGAISCDKNMAKILNRKIKEIKEKHNVYKYAEIKWVKVSKSKVDMYKELIDLFFQFDYVYFRAVIVDQKKELIFEPGKPSFEDLYYRIYYLLLKEIIDINYQYSIYVDIKDTKGSEKINKLQKVLNRTLYDFVDRTVSKIQLTRSDQVDIMGLNDLLIGAVSYKNRNLSKNAAKVELIEYIERKICHSLSSSTKKSYRKFNLFIWRPENAR